MIFITNKKELLNITPYVTNSNKIYDRIRSLKNMDIKNDKIAVSIHDKIYLSISDDLIIDFINGFAYDMSGAKLRSIKRSLKYNTLKCMSKCNLYDLFYKGK